MSAKITQAERMRRRRAAMTPEERAVVRAKNRERMRRKRAAQPPKAPKPRPPRKDYCQRTATVARLERELEDITDARSVIAYLTQQYKNRDTRRTYLAHLVAVKRDDPTYPKPPLESLREEMYRLKKEIHHAYGENARSDRDLKGWVPWEDLRAARERCDREGPLRDRVVFSLYTDFPPRRTEYRLLRVSHTMPAEDDAKNYVVLDADGTVRCITLGTYKTVKSYGRFTIPGALFTGGALAEYCATLQDGDYLWRRGLRGSSGWSKLLGDIAEKWAGKRATCNIFRKAFASYLARTQPNMTSNQREQVANDMGTSKKMLDLVYRKVS
jgi:hypothetical protein